MRACARANGATRCRFAACGITSAPPPSTDPFASRRSVTPISRGHANALGFQHPGAFRFRRSQRDPPHDQNAIASRSRSIRALLARGRETSRRRRDAPCLDASARAASGCGRTRVGAFDSRRRRQCGTSLERSTAARVRKARPVRAGLPWRMPGIGRRYSASGRKLRGRAAAQAVGHRFESGSSTTG